MTDADHSPDLSTGADPGSAESPTVVGIGASAGGLGALKTFLAAVPPDSGLAWVVVVHLSPEHESRLAELLQPHAPLPVQQVTETVRMEPDRVYVIPPGAHLDAVDGHLRLGDPDPGRVVRTPVDHFFRTLSRTYEGGSVGVVLTGTGSDGARGLREIKEKGGLTVVQDPGEAEYDGMPQSALATGLVDLVLPLAEIPGAVVDVVRTEPRVPVGGAEVEVHPGELRLLPEVFACIRSTTGRDFRRYKRSTLFRRITHRMQLRGLEELPEYVGLLERDESEVRALSDEFLVTVTRFFRDPEVFEALAARVVPSLFQGRGPGETIRVWSVGCATGEEVYSLAILLLEEAQRREAPPSVQLFATDLHAPALEAAREGFYAGDVAGDVSPERLERFFTEEDGGYRIRPEVRERVVFSSHDLLRDPPFSRIDLVSCRNVLIYLDRATQRDVLELFHYALHPGGLLLLGPAETAESGELFDLRDSEPSLYGRRSVPGPTPRLPVFSLSRVRLPGEPEPPVEEGAAPSPGALHQRMVERHGPPSVLVDGDGRVVHLSERAGRHFTFAGGEPERDLIRLVREELRDELRAAVRRARERGAPDRTPPVRVPMEGEEREVVAEVAPATGAEERGHVLILFSERPVGEAASGDAGGRSAGPEEGSPSSGPARRWEAELRATRKELGEVVAKYEASQQELWASNEELQSSNEELRSAMEELETSKEELQSMNEELQAANQENRHKVEELAQLSGDLQNLLSATDVATLFLDRDLRILRFTPAVAGLVNVRPVDRGRPLSDLTHRLRYDGLEEDARQVLRGLVPVEREVEDLDGRWYLTRVLPYRGPDDRIEGTVATFVDITERKRAQREREQAAAYAEKIVETLHEPLLVLHDDLRVKSANRAFYDHFEVREEETLGRKIYDLGSGQWDIPKLRTLLEEVLPENNVFNDYEVAHEFEDIGERVILLNARRLDHAQLILLGIRDITGRKRREEQLRRAQARQAFLLELSDALRPLSDPAAIQETACRTLGARLDVDWVQYGELDLDRGAFVVARDQHRRGADREDLPSHVGEYELDLFPVHAEAWLAGRSLAVEDVQEDPRLGDGERTGILGSAVRAALTTPLVKAGRPVAVLAALGAAPRRWSEEEIALVEEVAERTWEAVDRARAQEALRESETRYRTLFESIDEGFCVLEMIYDEAGRPVDYRFLEVNPAFGWQTGLGDPVGRTILELVAGHEEQWLERYARVAETGEPLRIEARAEGLGRWYDVHAFRTDAWGRGAVAVLFADVSERREAEEAQRRSEERFRSALRYSPIVFAQIDADFRYTWIFNPHPDFDPSVIVGRRDDELRPGPDTDALLALKRRVFQRGEQERVEITFALSDGERTYDITATPMKDGKGRVHSVVTASLDITERARAEEALRRSEGELRALIQASMDAVYRMSPDGSRMRYVEGRGFVADLTDPLENWVEAYVPEEERPRVMEAVQRAIRTRSVFELEHRIRRVDGSVGWTLSRAVPLLDEAGEVVEWIGAATDVTERKEGEAALERRVAERTREVRELARTLNVAEQKERQRLSHLLHDDLQQLLYGIQMKVNLALAKAERRDADGAVEEGRRSLELLDEAITRTRQLTVDLNPPILEGEGLVGALEWLRTQMKDRHGLEVEIRTEGMVAIPETDLRILLFQVARELLFNVAKHAGTDRALVEVAGEEGGVRLRVMDEGAGFDPASVPRGPRREGLGLFSVRERLRMRGGELEIDSEPGRGARVTAWVPFAPVP